MVYVWKNLYSRLNISVVNSALASSRHHIDTQLCSHHHCSLISLYYNLLNRVEKCEQATASFKQIADPVGWNETCAPCCPFGGFSHAKLKSLINCTSLASRKKSRNLAFLLLPWNAGWLAFPAVVKIIYGNWLNFLREIPELLKESKEPSTIKRAMSSTSSFQKQRKHHAAHQRKEIAVRMLTVTLTNLIAVSEQTRLKLSVVADKDRKDWGMNNQDLP